MSRNQKFKEIFSTEKKLLSVFTTAGYPTLNSTKVVVQALDASGVDFIELGFPFSDPVADGETIQKTNTVSIEEGMTLKVLFEQLKDFRKTVSMPIVLMGYLNPIVQFGLKNFLDACFENNIDGLIIPDLPLSEYKKEWEAELVKRNISFVFLVTPQTSDERIREIDGLSDSFIYAVSSQAVTGGAVNASSSPEQYYQRLDELNLNHPVIVGFGISDKESFNLATKYHKGAIIGSAFLRAIGERGELKNKVQDYISSIR
jgi:tryptophan synthase alpha chain